MKKAFIVFVVLLFCSPSRALIIPLYDPNAVHFGDSDRDSIVITTLILGASQAPANASSTGTQGTITWDANYIYMCVATNTWKRVAIETWSATDLLLLSDGSSTLLLSDGSSSLLIRQ